jgi:uncharacterized protein involved in exopolysaccharide biosynthesis
MVPAQYAQSTLSFAQVAAILRAHRRQSLIIALVMLIATLGVLKLWPKTYVAQATVMVNFEEGDANRQPPAELFANYLLTQVELLQSRELLMSAVNKLNLTSDAEFTSGFNSSGSATIEDFVLKRLRANLTVEQGKGLQLLYVSVASHDAQKAARIANAIVESYQSREMAHSNDPGSGRAHEYAEQLADLKAKVTAAAQRMAEFRQRTGVTDVDTNPQNMNAQNDVENQALAALEQQLLAAQNARRAAESRGVGDQSNSDQVMASQLIQNLKNQLSTLQAQLAESSSTLGPRHPKVLELESQIAATRRSLAREIGSFSQNSSGEASSAAQLEAKLKRAVDDQRAKLVNLRTQQDEGAKLALELESAETVYKRALDGYDQQLFASTSFVSHATPPPDAASPNKIMLAILGALVAGIAGLAVPLGRELMFNRRLHCRDDIERDLGLPVLAELHSISAEPSFT